MVYLSTPSSSFRHGEAWMLEDDIWEVQTLFTRQILKDYLVLSVADFNTHMQDSKITWNTAEELLTLSSLASFVLSLLLTVRIWKSTHEHILVKSHTLAITVLIDSLIAVVWLNTGVDFILQLHHDNHLSSRKLVSIRARKVDQELLLCRLDFI